ncbi:MAG: polysaccharide biosynthesis tyrosine autokinase [Dysgonomonas sp.]
MEDINKMSTNNTVQDPFLEDSQQKNKVTFDFVLWFYRILKHWYLFVLSLSICLGYAYVKNKAWIPRYKTKALMVLEARGTLGAVSTNLGGITQNWVNQQMILSSYDMVVRTVDKLPQMQVFYFHAGKFNIDNLYGRTPILIECQYIAPSAYGEVFTISPINSEKCKISVESTDNKPGFSIEVRYGEFVQESRFYIKVNKSERFVPNFTPFNFRFVTKGELINRYTNSISAYIEKEGSSALTIEKIGTNSAEDKDFLNALLAQYQDYNLLLKNEAADRAISFLNKQLSIVKDSLTVSEDAFRDYQNVSGLYGVVNENGSSSEIRSQRDAVIKELAELKVSEVSLKQVADIINTSVKNNTEMPDISSVGYNNPSISDNIVKYNTIVRSMQRMGEMHPMYQTQLKELNAIKLKMLTELNKIVGSTQEKQDQFKQKSILLDSQIATLPAQESTYMKYEKNFKLNETYDTYLTQKIREVGLQKATNTPDNYILEAPRQIGGAINGDERNQTYMFYFFLGLAIPLIFVICKEEIFNFTIATKEECERLAKFPVIGAVENVSKKQTKGRAIVKNFPKSSFAESFRNMRIRIEYMAQRESNIKVLVTSAEPADGKTFVAANIASIYQLTGRRVVLVDFDLRRPSVAKLLDIHSKRGVSNFLIGQVSLDEILITHPDYGFDVIPAGTLPPNPSELIKTKKTKDLIEYLHSKYDYVIIDCSPVGLVSDAYVLAKLVDTTLFVVRRAKTNKSFFKSVIGQLKNDGIYNVGLIFNDVKGREGYYGTSRYYGDKAYYLRKNSYYHDDYFEK